jgi:hypothetical protein
MSEVEAKDLLTELSQIKTATRARLYASGWQWLVVWSLTFLGAALTGLVPPWVPHVDVYWAYALPIALVLTALVSWRYESRLPVRQRDLPYWVIGMAMIAASFAASLLLSVRAVVVVIWVILGLGFAGFCWLAKVTPAAWLLAGMALLSGALGLVVDDTFELYPALALAFSAALGGTIAGMMVQARR